MSHILCEAASTLTTFLQANDEKTILDYLLLSPLTLVAIPDLYSPVLIRVVTEQDTWLLLPYCDQQVIVYHNKELFYYKTKVIEDQVPGSTKGGHISNPLFPGKNLAFYQAPRRRVSAALAEKER